MKKLILIMTGGLIGFVGPAGAQETNSPAGPGPGAEAARSAPSLESPAVASDLWATPVIGQGFRADAQEAGVSLGAGEETRDIGGKVHHDLLLSRFYYGHMLGNPLAKDKWYGGNFEIVPEMFGGWQYYKVNRYVIGATAVLRYNIATGTRWVPFMDAGVGGTLTDIGHPDLGSLGEFNGQIGPGIEYFWRDNVAFTAQYRYLHMSSGGLSSPNQGVNENIAYFGISWFF